MPDFGATEIPALLAIIGAATTAGTSIYNGIQQSDAQAAQKKALAQEQQSQANQAQLQRQQAVAASSGQAQAQTGGALTDTGFQEFAASLAGLPGYNASGTTTGTGSPATASVASQQTTAQNQSSGVDIQKIIQQLQGGGTGSNISGGNGNGQVPNPQTMMELSNPFVAP